MKVIDILVVILLVIGGLNWGFVGLFNFDPLAAMFGHGAFTTRLIYCLIGLSALYKILFWQNIQARWGK